MQAKYSSYKYNLPNFSSLSAYKAYLDNINVKRTKETNDSNLKRNTHFIRSHEFKSPEPAKSTKRYI